VAGAVPQHRSHPSFSFAAPQAHSCPSGWRPLMELRKHDLFHPCPREYGGDGPSSKTRRFCCDRKNQLGFNFVIHPTTRLTAQSYGNGWMGMCRCGPRPRVLELFFFFFVEPLSLHGYILVPPPFLISYLNEIALNVASQSKALFFFLSWMPQEGGAEKETQEIPRRRTKHDTE